VCVCVLTGRTGLVAVGLVKVDVWMRWCLGDSEEQSVQALLTTLVKRRRHRGHTQRQQRQQADQQRRLVTSV